MAMDSFDSAHLMNSHAASFFLEPAGIPRPWLLEPGKLPFGPAGMSPKRTVSRTVLSACLAIGTIQVIAWVRMLARPDILRTHRLVVRIGQDAVGPVLDQEVGVPLGGLRGL